MLAVAGGQTRTHSSTSPVPGCSQGQHARVTRSLGANGMGRAALELVLTPCQPLLAQAFPARCGQHAAADPAEDGGCCDALPRGQSLRLSPVRFKPALCFWGVPMPGGPGPGLLCHREVSLV